MSRPIYEPDPDAAIAANAFGVKDLRQRPLASRWYEPDCCLGIEPDCAQGGVDCVGDEPTLTSGNFSQPTAQPFGQAIEKFAYRFSKDGSLQTKGFLDASGATSGDKAFTLPGAGNPDEVYSIPNSNPFAPTDQTFALRVTTTGDDTGVTPATGYVDSATGDVYVRWAEAGTATTPGIEWYYIRSTTDWADPGPTILDWTLANGSWDTTDPTFAINGSSNVQVAKDGIYVYWIHANNVEWTGTTVNTVRLECARLGGEAPAGSHGWGTGAYNDIVRGPQAWTTPTSVAQFVGIIPNALDFFVFSPGSFPGAGPCEFSWRATQDEDGTPREDDAVVVHWIIVRLGDEWS